MIPTSSEDMQALLAQYLSAELASACEIAPELLDEAAISAAWYISSTRFSGGCLPSDFLDLIVARLLWTLGCENEAEACLRARLPDARKFELYRLFLRPEGPLEECWAVLHSQALNLEEWITMDRDPCWTIDLNRFVDLSGVFTELTLFQSLQRLFNFLAASWDDNRGPFKLGVKGLNAHTYREFAADILAFCRSIFSEWSVRRGWSRLPGVYALEIPA